MQTTQTTLVPSGQTLTIVADANSYGTYNWLPTSTGGSSTGVVTVSASTTTKVGPFSTDQNYAINTTAGALTFTVALVDLPSDLEPSDLEAVTANMNNLPAGRSFVIGSNSQSVFWKQLTVIGKLTLAGEMRIGPWPF